LNQPDKKNILFVVNGLAIGGGELKVLDLVKGLNLWYNDEFDCTVCSVGQGGPLFERFEELGITPYVFEKKAAFDFSLIPKVAALIRDKKIDIVHTTLFYADVIGAFAARLAGVKKIISWEAVTEVYTPKQIMAYKLASRLYTKSVAVSRAIENKVQSKYKVPSEKTITIHYGVDLSRFYPFRDEAMRMDLGFKKNDVVFGTVARFTEQKGHRYLIEAAKDVISKESSVHFVLAGDGPLREEIEGKISELGLDKNFHLLGFRTDIDKLLHSFDVFLLPSLYEGLPNAVLEAMAAGLPVIATAVDGTPEAVIHNESGILIEPKNPEAIRDSVLRLFENIKLRDEFGKNARQRVEESFSWEKEVSEFVELYKSL